MSKVFVWGSRRYKIRENRAPSRRAVTDHVHYSITIPSNVAEMVKDREFVCELTDEGILFRPVEKINPTPIPDWIT